MPRSVIDRAPWALLGLAMVGTAALALHQGRGLELAADELSYFGRTVDSATGPVAYPFGLEYLLAPHNGHLQLVGKLVYEASFGVFGADYAPLRTLEVVAICACAGLLFWLARTRVGDWAALAAACALLFCGAAWEVMLWPFDLHTVGALAFGLLALAALERPGRRADVVACLVLVASVLTIEVGLAFALAAAALVLARRDGARGLWVCAPALVLYAAWWAWAQRFDHEGADLANLGDLPGSAAESFAAAVAALTGMYAHGNPVSAAAINPDPAAAVVAGVAALALGWGLWRARRSPRVPALLTALAVYWAFIALADRPPDSSRYAWVGVALLLLLAAEALAGVVVTSRGRWALTAALAALVAVSLPSGLAKLGDGRDFALADAATTGVELAMLELAGERAAPGFNPGADPYASSGIPSEVYLDATRRIGSPALSLDEVRSLDPALRTRADQVLALAYAVRPQPAGSPAARRGCLAVGSDPVALPRGGALLFAPKGGAPLAVGRFAADPSVDYGRIAAGASELRLPADAAADPWLAFTARGVLVCELDAG